MRYFKKYKQNLKYDNNFVYSYGTKVAIINREYENSDLKATYSEIRTSKSMLEELNVYKYDPKCDLCVNNAGEHISHSERTQALLDKSSLSRMQEGMDSATKILFDTLMEKPINYLSL